MEDDPRWKGSYAAIAQFIERSGPFEAPCLDVGGYNGPFSKLFPKPYYILDNAEGDGEVINIKGWVIDGELTGLGGWSGFGTVVSTEAFEHFDDPIRCFINMAKVLRSGGKLLITSPSAWGYHPSPKDYWRAQHDAWPYMAKKAGVEILTYESPQTGDGACMGFFLGKKL